MKFADHLIGNATIPALHGGTLGALLESTAVFKLMLEGETIAIPKTINITVEYLRTGKARDTFARAQFTRHGRRVANVRAFAYQDDPDKPIAAANAHFLLVPPDE
jgi:acyl-coenzyme A thioesterase PaaI-like protein